MMIWFSCLCGKTCEICETLLKWGVSKYNYVQENKTYFHNYKNNNYRR